jgi:excisionase family DNA binding protein
MNSYVDVAALKARLAKAAAEGWGMPSQSDYDAWQRWQGANTAKPERRRRRPERNRPRPLDGLLTTDEAAARLRCSVKTLNGYIASGAIRYVAIGHGSKRPRKMFTATDLDDFIANQTRKDAPACQSSRTHVRLSGGSTSRSEVIAFSARRNAAPSGKQKK